jgi:hypothetical protein
MIDLLDNEPTERVRRLDLGMGVEDKKKPPPKGGKRRRL